MLVAENKEIQDSYIVGGMLARSLSEYLTEQDSSRDPENINLINFLRMLEMYEYSSFSHYASRGVLEWSNAIDDINNSVFSESKQNRLYSVIEAAHNKVYPDLEKNELVERVARILKAVYQGEKDIDDMELKNVRNFLNELMSQISS